MSLPAFWTNRDVFVRVDQHVEQSQMILNVNTFPRSRTIQETSQDLKQLNEQLASVNERLATDQRDLLRQQRLAVLGKLVATIAHKIGTPLTAISGHLQLLLEDPTLFPAHQERIQLVFNQTERLHMVMQDLLNFARPPSLTLEPVSIPHCLEQALQLFRPVLEKQQIVVRTQINSSIPPACADSLQLQEALNNLIDNAIDAMPEGGSLTIRAWVPKSEAFPEQEPGVCVTIQDSGPGIPQHHLASIFEPFFTTKDIGEGSGLGLAITSEILHQHNGKITVESKEGAGTSFQLWLPLWSGNH